jgi:hypothetical protein
LVKIASIFLILFFVFIFPVSVFSASQTVSNLVNDVCELETSKTFSSSELPMEYALNAAAVNRLGRVFLGAKADWNLGVILFTATAPAGPTTWVKSTLLNGKVATVRSITPHPDKDGEAIAELTTYATEDKIYWYYTYNNGASWALAKDPEEGGPGLTKTYYIKFNQGFDSFIFLTNSEKNKIYLLSGTPPLMQKTEYTTISLLSRIGGIVSFEDGNVFVHGIKSNGHPAILRATGSDFKEWEETEFPLASGSIDGIAKAPDGGFLAFLNNGLDANIYRSENGTTWLGLLKNIRFDSTFKSIATSITSSKSGVIVAYSSGDIYRFKSTQGNAALENMFGKIPFLGSEGYNFRGVAAKPEGYLVNATGRTLRTLKCNSQPFMYPKTITGRKGQIITMNTIEAVDYDKDELTYSWSQTEGPGVDLSSITSPAPTFSIDETGVLKFDLSIGDGGYPIVEPLVVQYTVNVIQNDAPIVLAENDKECTVNQTCIISSTASDADGDLVMYFWTKQSGPSLVFENSFQPSVSFIPTNEGAYVFKIEVTDSINQPNSDTISVVVKGEQQVQTPPVNTGEEEQNASEIIPTNPVSQPPNTNTISNSGGPIDKNYSIIVDENIFGQTMFPIIIEPDIEPEQSQLIIEWSQKSGPRTKYSVDENGFLAFIPAQEGTYVFEVNAVDINGAFANPKQVTVTVEKSTGSNKVPIVFEEQINNLAFLAMVITGIIIALIAAGIVFVIFILSRPVKPAPKKRKNR